MNELLKASALTQEILKAANTMDKANALISKWRANRDGSFRDLGPNPAATAAALEARNQVYGWGR